VVSSVTAAGTSSVGIVVAPVTSGFGKGSSPHNAFLDRPASGVHDMPPEPKLDTPARTGAEVEEKAMVY